MVQSGGGGGSPSTEVVTDADKALAILVANVVIIIVVVVCFLAGFRENEVDLRPPFPVGWWVGEGLVILLGLALGPLARVVGQSAVRIGRARAKTGTPSPPDPPPRPARTRWSEAGLWVMTIVNFAAVGFLVQGTGGAIISPFAQLLIALFLLSPYLMTETWSKRINLVGGMLYYVVLLLLVPNAHPLNHRAGRWVYGLITLLIIAVSLGFLLFVEWLENQNQ